MMTMSLSLSIRIRRHCIDELIYFLANAFHAAHPSGCCFESGLPAKRTRELLAAPLVNKNAVKLLDVNISTLYQ